MKHALVRVVATRSLQHVAPGLGRGALCASVAHHQLAKYCFAATERKWPISRMTYLAGVFPATRNPGTEHIGGESTSIRVVTFIIVDEIHFHLPQLVWQVVITIWRFVRFWKSNVPYLLAQDTSGWIPTEVNSASPWRGRMHHASSSTHERAK